MRARFNGIRIEPNFNFLSSKMSKTTITAIVFLASLLTVVYATTTVTNLASADTCIDPYNGQNAKVTVYPLYHGTRIPMMKFDLSGIPADAYIISAQLNLTFESWGTDWGGPQSIKVFDYTVQDVWTEFTEDATWDSSGITSWAALGMKDAVDKNTILNRVFLLNVFNGQNWTTVETRESVQASIENSRNWAGFMFTAFQFSAYIFSRESTNPPTLTITWAQGVPRASLPDIIIKSSDEWSAGGTVSIPSSNSIIPQGTTPVYTWTLVSAPPGSSHVEGETVGSDATLSLTADVPGFYHVRLRIAKSDDANAFTEADSYVQVGIKTERPRVHISKDYVNTHIKNANLTAHPWPKLLGLAANNGYWSFAYEEIYTLFMLWQATGNQAYCQQAWDNSIKPILFVNGDPNQGYLTLDAKFGGDSHSAAFMGGQYLGNFPVAIDWGFDCLSTFQKDSIVEWVHHETEYMLSNGFFETYLRNDGVIILSSISRAFAALYGYDNNVNRFAELYVKGWAKLKRAWGKTGRGGSSGEGNGYGHSTANYLIVGAHAMWTATGEDVFEELDFFKQKLMFDAFGLWPRTFGNPNDPYGTAPYGYPMWEMSGIGGDGRRSLGWISIAIRPVGQALLTRYKDTEEGNAFAYLVRPVPDEWDIHELIYPVVRNTPQVPTKLSHYAEGMGYVYIRSDWTPDSTWFAFWAGPHVDLHQHLDQGAFNIYKRRDLAIKSGSYDSGAATSDHSVAYYTRTISANGILIIDPEEQFMHFIGGRGCMSNNGWNVAVTLNNGLCPPNDGGQCTCSPLAMSVGTVEYWENNFYIYDTAKVTSFYDFEGVVSIASDLTNAYNNPLYTTTWNKPKVNQVLRKTLYIRDLDIFLVGDVIEATNSTFRKKTLLHALQMIEIDTDVNTVIENERKGIDRYRNVKSGKIIMDDTDPSNPNQITYDLRWGNSTLLFETAFPSKFSYRLVGGRNPVEGSYADFWVDDYAKDAWGGIQSRSSVNYPVTYAIETAYNTFGPTYVGGYGRYRLEVEAETNEATDYFLNIYRPTVDGINNEIPAYTTFEDSDFFGVVFNVNGREYKAKFPKNGDAPFVGDAPPTIPVAVPASPGTKTPGNTPGKPTISAASSVVASLALGLAALALAC